MTDESSRSVWSERATADPSGLPVEITLEPASGGADDAADDEVDHRARAGRPRRSTPGTVIVAVLAAAAVGFTIGQMTSGDPAEPSTTTEQGPEPTVPEVTTDDEAEPTAPAPRRRSDFVDVPPELDGVDLVGLTTDGELLRIDGRTGTAELWPITGFDAVGATEQTVGGQLDRPLPRAVHFGDQVVVVDPLGRSNHVLDDHAVATPAVGDLAGAIAVHPTDDPDEVWSVHLTSVPGQIHVRRTRVDGFGTRGAFLLDAHFVVADQHGGLFVQMTTGIHHLHGDQLTRVTVGQLHGTGDRHLLVHRCDGDLDCDLVLHDRRTGDDTPVELPDDISSGLVGPQANRISPDGRYFLAHQRSRHTPAIVDLVTGHTIEHASFPDTLRDHTWTPRGNLVYSLGDTAYLHTPDDGGTQALTGFPPLVNIDVRPASIPD